MEPPYNIQMHKHFQVQITYESLGLPVFATNKATEGELGQYTATKQK